MDRDELASILGARLSREPGVAAAWLFGSAARGEERPDSDVDVAVLFDRERPLDALLDLEAALGAELGRDVDLVDARGAPPDLVHRILRDGVLVVDEDPSARIAFEVDVRNRYFDMRPIWLLYRRARGAGA
ncbi:MAG TPA: nucleotidyltransferase domain-containing protein [Minicystis sp.]|nr:nucleotidyltransferase domain-containing protein [Minicystis sp.]